jgi:hypothetical protein
VLSAEYRVLSQKENRTGNAQNCGIIANGVGFAYA